MLFWDILTLKDNAISKAVDIMEGMDETKTEGINVLKNKGKKDNVWIDLYQKFSIIIPFLNMFHLLFRFLDDHWMEWKSFIIDFAIQFRPIGKTTKIIAELENFWRNDYIQLTVVCKKV